MRKHLSNSLLFLMGLLGFKSTTALGDDIFLCDPAGKLQGESTDERARGCMDVLTWDWGITNPPGDGTDEKAHLQDLTCTLRANKASPVLMQLTAAGEMIPQLQVKAFKACCEYEYYKITMSDVLVTSYQTGGSSGDTIPVDSISLNFVKIEQCYTEQGTEVDPGETTCRTYSLEVKPVSTE